jgi:hypothetical protein
MKPIPNNDTHALFISLVAGKPFGQATLNALEPTLAEYGIALTPPNAAGDRTKIGDPVSRRWTRVGFGEGQWVWVVQSDVYTPPDVVVPIPPTPPPEPPSVPPVPVIPYDEDHSVDFGRGINEANYEYFVKTGIHLSDGGMISVHSQRCAWDHYVGGLPWQVAKIKHLNEYRDEYGLPHVS